MYYLKEAADLGQQDAQEELATAYNRRNNEQEQNRHYATLTASAIPELAVCWGIFS